MPIDLRLLRSSDDAKQVEQWERLRARFDDDGDADDDEDTPSRRIEQVIQLDQASRQALKEQNAYKSSCRQERKKADPELLQAHQKKCQELSTKLQQELCRISNFVDETVLAEVEVWQAPAASELSKRKGKVSLAQSPYGRLVELGAWEVIGNLQNANGMLCWSGLGIQWGQGLSSYLESFILQPNIQVLQLPDCLELESEDLHGMMGSRYLDTTHKRSSWRVCLSDTPCLEAPSWLKYLKLQYSDQTLGDKQLPKVMQYTVRRCSSDVSCLDPREELRENTLLLPSAAKSVERTIHHILILTSSTYYDSRQVQTEWIGRLVDFYRSLLPAVGDSTDLVRTRAVAAPDLLPAEASRVVVEGYVPSKKKGGHWMILAYLSNFSDYPTRACRIKNNQQTFCHVLQGTLCSLPETMSWQAANAAADGEITFSEAFRPFFPNVPRVVKKLETTKNGRLEIRAVSTKETKATPTVAKPANQTKKEKSSILPLLEPSSKASAEQIRGEALSSSFKFLPFYHSS